MATVISDVSGSELRLFGDIVARLERLGPETDARTVIFMDVMRLCAAISARPLLGGVVTGGPIETAPAALKGVRTGLPRRHFWENLDVEIEQICESALQWLSDAGLTHGFHRRRAKSRLRQRIADRHLIMDQGRAMLEGSRSEIERSRMLERLYV